MASAIEELDIEKARKGIGEFRAIKTWHGGEVPDTLTKLLIWDAVPRCVPSQCVAESYCRYSYSAKGRCKVMLAYITGVIVKIYGHFKKDMTDKQILAMGLHLVPLYKTLCKFKLEEMGVERVTQVGNKGKLYAHPIYKEIRETLRVINQTWSLYDIDKKVLKSPFDPPVPVGEGKASPTGDNTHGDRSYYDSMFEDSEEPLEKDSPKPKKRRKILKRKPA
jgi:hypothetical protein